jgi:hypothetical protein
LNCSQLLEGPGGWCSYPIPSEEGLWHKNRLHRNLLDLKGRGIEAGIQLGLPGGRTTAFANNPHLDVETIVGAAAAELKQWSIPRADHSACESS